MKAVEVYKRLDEDFIKAGIKDINWATRMPLLHRYIYPEYISNGGMGLMCDFTKEVTQVLTTVFLSDELLTYIKENDICNAMILSHHPTNWNLMERNGNYPVDETYITELQARNISLYILHHPLDNFSKYSTCFTLAEVLGIENIEPAFLYYGAYCGVIGTTPFHSLAELSKKFTETLSHQTSLVVYGSNDISGRRIAICPGGGNDIFVVNEMIDKGISTLVTGLTILNQHSKAVHKLEKEKGINILGGTHYSTEKYAPMAMVEYFKEMNLVAHFVEGTPHLFDL